MHETYDAVLQGGQLQWGEAGPPPGLGDGPVPVKVTVCPPAAPPGAAFVAALEAFAAAGGPKSFGDPVEWQREVRADKPQPGRDE